MRVTVRWDKRVWWMRIQSITACAVGIHMVIAARIVARCQDKGWGEMGRMLGPDDARGSCVVLIGKDGVPGPSGRLSKK